MTEQKKNRSEKQMEKQMKQVQVAEIDGNGFDDWSVVNVIAFLQKVMRAYPDHQEFEVTENVGWNNITVEIWAKREETDEEYDKRVEREEANINAELIRKSLREESQAIVTEKEERALLARLLAKFPESLQD